MKSPAISLEDDWAEILNKHCPTYANIHFETHKNVFQISTLLSQRKSCPVDNLTFVENQKDAKEKYPPYSCIITATSLQNKELVLAPGWYIWQSGMVFTLYF